MCTGSGFQATSRPDESVCQPERDALIECAYPKVRQCLDICREAELTLVTDAGAPEGITCPSRDAPCDSICWLASPYLEGDPAEIDAAGRALMSCALDRVAQCYEGSDASLPTWSVVLPECAESLGL